ncbi:hypothetical protein PTTG_26228, partial [Puccinia triticina 1-1 BBBD Race 1]
ALHESDHPPFYVYICFCFCFCFDQRLPCSSHDGSGPLKEKRPGPVGTNNKPTTTWSVCRLTRASFERRPMPSITCSTVCPEAHSAIHTAEDSSNSRPTDDFVRGLVSSIHISTGSHDDRQSATQFLRYVTLCNQLGNLNNLDMFVAYPAFRIT